MALATVLVVTEDGRPRPRDDIARPSKVAPQRDSLLTSTRMSKGLAFGSARCIFHSASYGTYLHGRSPIAEVDES